MGNRSIWLTTSFQRGRSRPCTSSIDHHTIAFSIHHLNTDQKSNRTQKLGPEQILELYIFIKSCSVCGIYLQDTKQELLKLHVIAAVKTSVFNMSLLIFSPFLLLWWDKLVELFLFLHWNHAECVFLPCQGCVRQEELPHLRGVLGLHRALEHRLGDQMFQVLFHPLHHHLLLSVLFLIISFAWGHAVAVV